MAGPDLTYTPGPDLTYTPDVEAPKKEPRSAIAEIANQGYAGVVADLPEMVGKTAQYATNPGDLIYGWGKGVADAAKARGAQPDLQPDPANHNIVTNTLASGARMIPQSIVPAAVVGGAVAGAGVAGPGALLIGSALGSLPAAMSQGQTTLDKAEEAGVGRDIAIPAARKTALIEGAGETLGTFAGAKLLGLGGKALSTTLARATGKAEGSAAGHVLADATDASVLKPWLKQIPETLATEVGTEMGQNAGEAYVEQQAGIDKQTPWDAAKEAIGPTVGMTALLAPFGLAGFGIRAKQNARRAEALTSAETAPGERLKAAFEIKTQLDEINPEAGKNFGEHVLQAIEDQTPLEIGEHLFAPPTGVARDAASDTANQEAGAAVDDQINMVGEPTVPTPEGFVREEPSNTIIPPAPQQVAAVPADNAQGATVIDRNTGPLSAAVVDLGITPNDAQTLGGLFKAHYSKLDAETALAALPDPERYRITQHPNSTVPGALAVIPKPANVLADMDLKAATQQANEARTQQVEQEDGNAAPAPIKPAPGVPTPPPTATQAMAGDLALANEAAQSELQAPVAQPVAEMPGPAKMSAKMTEAARLAAIQRNATVQAEEALPGALAPTQPTEKANVPKANQTKQAKPATQTEEDAAQSEIAQSTGKLSLPRSPRLPGETNEAYQARRAAELNARKAATPTSVPPTQERDTQAARTALGKEATGEEQVVLTKDLPDQRNAPKGHVSRQAAEFIGHVSKLFGKRVVFVKGMKPDGMRTAGNTIYLSTNSSVAHLRVAGHEMVHAMKAQHRKAYNHMRDALKSVLTDAELIKQHKDYAGKELDPADLDDAMRDFLTEEWLADLGGNRFAEAGFWQDVFTQVEAKHGTEAAKGIIAKLRLAIVNALQKLLKIVNGNAFAVDARMAENLDQIRKAVAEGFVQYAQAVKNGQLETETEGVKFSRRTNDFTRGEDRTEVSTTVPTAKTRGTVTDDAVDQKWIIDARDIRYSKKRIVGSTEDYTPAMLATMSKLGWQVEVPTLKERAQALWKDAGKKLAQGIADQFAPVKDLDGKAYGLLRLAKGASGAFEALLKGGKLKLTDNVYDIDTAERGGVVDKLLLPLQGEHHNFFRWVAAQRAEQLKQVGKENLFDQSDIDTINDWTNTTPAKFDYVIQHGVRRGQTTRNRAEMFRDSNVTFNAFNKNVLDLAEQSGLIDGSTRHIWENEFYVPFYRVADEADGGVRGMNIKGSVVRQKAFERLKGGKQKLNADLLDNTLMNWAHLLDASAKNRAAKATIDAAEAMGIAMGGNQTALAQMGNTVGNKNGVVWFMDQGQKRYSLIDNQGDGQYLMTALTSLEYAGMRNPAMQAMGAMKHALTVGVTASPFFKVRNLIRDSVQVIGTGPISYNVGKNLAEGWKLTDPKSDAYFRLLAGGGTIHFGTMLEGSEAKRIQALVESGVPASTILNDPTKVKALWSKMSDAVGIYNEIGNRGEAINRAALYDQLRKQGKSHAEASLEARDLMDFSMQGAWTSVRFLTQVVPFLNARIQGLYKLGKAAKQDPARISLVLGATAMASLALLAAYGDDDDWKKRTDSDRNNFWWFKLGGVAYRIPKPFEIGAIGTLAERGFELAFDNEMTGERFRGQALALLSDQLSMNPIPQLVKPMLDVYSNIDSFSGRPIENMAQQKLKAEYRFNDRTSMAARGASTAMNAVTGVIGKETLSPVQVDHLLRGYFGWLGTMVVSAGDVLARPATDQPKQASTDWLKALTGNMASDLRDAPSRYVGQMYEQAAKNAEAYATWKLLQKEQKPAEAAAFAADHRDKLMAYRRTEAAKKSETLFNNMVRMVERNRELDPDQKREKLRAIQIQKEAVAKRAVAV